MELLNLYIARVVRWDHGMNIEFKFKIIYVQVRSVRV
jgi:hypothetical protein